MNSIQPLLRPLVYRTTPDRSFKNLQRFQTCIGNVCLPCPHDIALWGSTFGRLEAMYPIIAGTAVISCLFLLLCYNVLPSKTTKRSIFTHSLAISHLFLCGAFFFSFSPSEQRKTVCYDSVTRANALEVPRCAASGTFLVFGVLTTRSWLMLWIFDMHLKIVWARDTCSQYRWTAYSLCFGLPLSMTVVSIFYIEYVQGLVCLPRLGMPIQLLLEIPMLIFDAVGAIFQVWTFVYILWTVSRSPKDSRKLSIRTINARLQNSPFSRTLRLMLKPLLYTTLCVIDSIIFLVSFFTDVNPWGPDGLPTKEYAARAVHWLDCLIAHGGQAPECDEINKAFFNWPVLVAAWYYSFIMANIFMMFCHRWESIIGILQLCSTQFSRRHSLTRGLSKLAPKDLGDASRTLELESGLGISPDCYAAMNSNWCHERSDQDNIDGRIFHISDTRSTRTPWDNNEMGSAVIGPEASAAPNQAEASAYWTHDAAYQDNIYYHEWASTSTQRLPYSPVYLRALPSSDFEADGASCLDQATLNEHPYEYI